MSLPPDELEFKSIRSQTSLLDYDISIFNPDISSLSGYPSDSYLGKPSLNDTYSFKLQEQLAHWRREILGALRAGKTVVILLNILQEVYVATGDKSYSGTGRNRQITRHVTSTTNYSLIPGGIDVVNSNGTSMKLFGHDNALTTYWAELGSLSEFRVLISGEGIRPLVVTKTGDKTVGAYLKYKDVQGTLVLLPYIDFDHESFTRTTRSGNEHWTDKAIQVGKQFISAIAGMDNYFIQGGEYTPSPEWVTHDRFALAKEQNIRSELLALETKIGSIQKEKEKLQQILASETEVKGLLYEKGTPLENAILKSLKILGFECSKYRVGDSEFDVVFQSKEGRFIGEAEGKDNKAISIDKLRQLEMNIHEDFSRDEVNDMAKGVLIGNAYRLLPLEERGDFFTEKCLIASNRSKVSLVKSTDLFLISRYLLSKADKIFAKRCRKTIIETAGIVTFPKTPELEPQAPQQFVSKSSD